MPFGVPRDGGPKGVAPALAARPPGRIASMPFGLPSLTPRVFATASASFVRREIASCSCFATSAMMPTVQSFASGRSTAASFTPLEDCCLSSRGSDEINAVRQFVRAAIGSRELLGEHGRAHLDRRDETVGDAAFTRMRDQRVDGALPM